MPTFALPFDDSTRMSTNEESTSLSCFILTSAHPPMFSPTTPQQQKQKEYEQRKRKMSTFELPSASYTYNAPSVMNEVYNLEKECFDNPIDDA